MKMTPSTETSNSPTIQPAVTTAAHGAFVVLHMVAATWRDARQTSKAGTEPRMEASEP